MVVKFLLNIGCIIFFTYPILACDICNLYDYSNRENRNFVGIFYRYRLYNGYQETNPPIANRFFFDPTANPKARTSHEISDSNTYLNKTSKDFQRFETIELRFNYNIKDKINLQILLPWSRHYLYFNEIVRTGGNFYVGDSTTQLNGLGDPFILGDYVFRLEKAGFMHILRPGLGIKFPIGQYLLSDKSKRVYPYDIQTGIPSLDILLRFNYTMQYKKWGLDFFNNLRFSTLSANKVLQGSRVNSFLSLFYLISIKKFTLIPRLGLYYESAEKDIWKNNLQINTGGRSLFGQIGFDCNFNPFILQILYQHPFSQKLNGEVIQNAGRLNLGLMFSF